MLIRRTVLEAIRAGRVDRAFRRWRRPTVKPGGALRTTVGVLSIDAVDRIFPRDLTEPEARRAGHGSREELLSELASREGDLYRIRLRFAGPDPRVALRDRDRLTGPELAELARRLRRLDGTAPWTGRALRWIAAHPGSPASRLAAHLGREPARVKASVRRLKELGLTESLSPKPGYRLSRRGAALLRRSRSRGKAGSPGRRGRRSTPRREREDPPPDPPAPSGGRSRSPPR